MSNPRYAVAFVIFMAYTVTAYPRYLAIPIDEVNIIELSPILPASPRIARQADEYIVPVTVSKSNHEENENLVPRPERSTTRILDYIDFGGHTGVNGAFGWYADYPAHN
ncbi:uncharacterized protein LOC107268442 [Cephus cinctus]|uniref:Uncharacterized protein LOC107268442 n=1 Tax=Cephus cinctus TaxID=211228 RepID=A0AAJ7BXH1_CEPCN|nr:uncharacterized protein LOC107268442 [Cephus cinctus]